MKHFSFMLFFMFTSYMYCQTMLGCGFVFTLITSQVVEDFLGVVQRSSGFIGIFFYSEPFFSRNIFFLSAFIFRVLGDIFFLICSMKLVFSTFMVEWEKEKELAKVSLNVKSLSILINVWQKARHCVTKKEFSSDILTLYI